MTRNQLFKLLGLMLVFGVLYSLISIVNHLLFRTYSLDLGLYTHALYQYSQLKLAGSTMIKEYFEPMPGSHFDLHLMLFSPLVHLWGTYTLLIVQILAVLAGGLGTWKYLTVRYPEQTWISWGGMVCFYSYFSVFSAINVSYHSVVVATSALPWLLLAIHKKRWMWVLFLWLFMIIAQENISLWVIFVLLSLALMHRKDKHLSHFLLLLMALSLVYFMAVVWFIIPAFSWEGHYTGFHYTTVGNNLQEAFQNFLFHPGQLLRGLYINHSGNPGLNGVKTEFYIFLLLSGFWLLFRKPLYILMILPLLFQKMWNDNPWIWSVGGQYSIEFAPVVIIGAFSGIAEMKPNRVKLILIWIMVLSNIALTFRLMDNTQIYFDKSHIRFYSNKHYSRHYDVRMVRHQLRNIPKEAKVSAQCPFVPHLALRDHIYQFPLIKDAEYIVVSYEESPWPLNDREFELQINKLENDQNWILISQSEGASVFKRSKEGKKDSDKNTSE